jgi:hypothetical protein
MEFLFVFGNTPESTAESAAKFVDRKPRCVSGKVALFQLGGLEPFTAPSIHSKP